VGNAVIARVMARIHSEADDDAIMRARNVDVS